MSRAVADGGLPGPVTADARLPLAWRAALAASGLVGVATLVRIAWLVRDALRPCQACDAENLPDLGPVAAALGTIYGALYAVLAGSIALGLARVIRRPGRRLSGVAAILCACLALGLVHGLEGRVSASFWGLNLAAALSVAALVARRWRAEPPSPAQATVLDP